AATRTAAAQRWAPLPGARACKDGTARGGPGPLGTRLGSAHLRRRGLPACRVPFGPPRAGRVAWAIRRRSADAASAAATKEAVISGVAGRTSTRPEPQASPVHPVAERRERCEDAVISS